MTLSLSLYQGAWAMQKWLVRVTLYRQLKEIAAEQVRVIYADGFKNDIFTCCILGEEPYFDIALD